MKRAAETLRAAVENLYYFAEEADRRGLHEQAESYRARARKLARGGK